MRRADSLEKTLMLGKIEGRRRRRHQSMRRLDGITDSKDMSLSKLREIVKFMEAWGATVHGVRKSQTQLRDRTTATAKKKKKGTHYWCDNMGGSQNHHAKWKKSDPKGNCIRWHSGKGKTMKTDGRKWLPKDWPQRGTKTFWGWNIPGSGFTTIYIWWTLLHSNYTLNDSFFFFWLRCLWDLNSQIRDWTQALKSETGEP